VYLLSNKSLVKALQYMLLCTFPRLFLVIVKQHPQNKCNTVRIFTYPRTLRMLYYCCECFITRGTRLRMKGLEQRKTCNTVRYKKEHYLSS
jgi:hypothetical protein